MKIELTRKQKINGKEFPKGYRIEVGSALGSDLIQKKKAVSTDSTNDQEIFEEHTRKLEQE
jgi:hypothetical protein